MTGWMYCPTEREGLLEQIGLDRAELRRLWELPELPWFAIDRLLNHIAYCESRLDSQNQSTV